MPGFLTHYLFGKQLLKHPNMEHCSPMFINAITKHRNVYNLGLQGPDLFFYYLPCNLDKNKKLGNIMHVSHIGDYFSYCVNYLNSITDIRTRDIFTAYLAGAIGHYTLDCTAHPFIYFRTDYHKENAEGIQYTARHCQYETYIDQLMLKRIMYLVPSKFKSNQTVKLNKEETEKLSICLSDIITAVYMEECEHSYTTKTFMSRSIKMMPIGVKFLNTRTKIKRSIIRAIEKVTVKANILSCLVSVDQSPEKDFFNLNQETWYNPWDNSIKQTASFIELFDQATLLYIDRILALSEFYEAILEHKKTLKKKQTLLQLIGSASYNSGLFCSD